jgi:hypothetical protein
MKWTTIAKGVASAALLCLLPLLACKDSESGGPQSTDDETVIAAALADMMQALEDENLPGTMAFIWEDFLHSGLDRAELQAQMEENFSSVDYPFSLSAVAVTVAANGQTATVSGHIIIEDAREIVIDTDFGPDEASPWLWWVHWAKIGNDWLICSNQARISFRGQVQHYHPDTYYLGLSFQGDAVASVQVAGPGTTSVWQHSEGHWVVNLSGRPAIGDHFIVEVEFADATTETCEYSVVGVNDDFAWFTSPTDGAIVDTTTPTFTWNAVVGIVEYGLYFSDDGSNLIWYRSAVSTETSCTYNDDGGALVPLQSGHSYTVYLHSFDANANQASTEITFIVQ